MVSEKFKILVGKVKTRLSDIKPEDIANFAIKEAAGSIPFVGQYIKDAIDEFSPDEKLELLTELKEISQNQFTELSKGIGVSVEYLKDIKTFTYDACAIQKADHVEIKGLLYRILNQTKIDIEKQNAENIYNVAGNLIIQHPITQKPIKIPTIEETLKKGRKLEGEFFKEEPRWIDFEDGFIVERKEVNDIITKLKKEKTQLILGAPASGKSIILKNVGFKLAKDNKSVNVVELKQHSRDEIKRFFENIPKISTENSIFIVDDAHIYFGECEKLIEDFEMEGKGNLIIGSRETEEIIKGHLKEDSEFRELIEKEKCFRIKAEDVTEEMIKTFLEKKPKEYNFSAERIKIVSDNLEKYKKDLWHLSWALKAYNPEKDSVSRDEICEKIRDSIRNIGGGKGQDEIKIILNAEDVFLPLSVFYRFEIPIERNYLEEHMGIEGNIINQLIGLQEIVETEETGKHKMISLHHSSIAKLYFDSYHNFPDLGKRTKKKILNEKDEKDLEYCFFYRYFITTDTDPRNVVDAVINLGKDFYNKMGGLTLLDNLIKEDKIQKSIVNGMNKEENIENVGSIVSCIDSANTEMAQNLVNRIDFKVLSSKIDKEEGIEKVGWCVSVIAMASKEKALELANRIDIKVLSSKVNKEDNIENVGWYVSGIAGASKEKALELANRIDKKVLSTKIDKEEDIRNVRLCVSGIAWVSKEVAMKLVDSVSARINKEKDIEKVGSCVSGIAEASEEVAMKLANNIDIKVLSTKIDKEEDIYKVGLCIHDISWASKEVGFKLVDSIDKNVLSSKIEKEEDIENVGLCVWGIARASEEVAMKLVNSIDFNALSSKINKEENIYKVGLCVSSIALESEEVAMKLMDSVSARINKEEVIEKVGLCILGIARASEEVANEIITRLNPKLREEVQKWMPGL